MSPETALKGKPVTWLTTYAEVRDAFKTPELLQTSYDGAKDTIFADVLVTLDGARHDHRRRTEVTLFRPQIVAALEKDIVPADAAGLIATLKTAGEADLTNVSRLISTGLAARIIGLDDCEAIDRLEALSALMARLHRGAVIDWSTRPREEVLTDVREAREQYREQFFGPALRRRETTLQAGKAQDSPDLIHQPARQERKRRESKTSRSCCTAALHLGGVLSRRQAAWWLRSILRLMCSPAVITG